MWILVESCKRGRMRGVKLDVRKMRREEGFIAFGRTELSQVLRRDIVSFKQKARSKDIKNAHSEMYIL